MKLASPRGTFENLNCHVTSDQLDPEIFPANSDHTWPENFKKETNSNVANNIGETNFEQTCAESETHSDVIKASDATQSNVKNTTLKI